MNGAVVNEVDPASQLFDQLISAVTCKSILSTFHDLCDCLGVTNTDHRQFYRQLKTRLTSWKAKSLWTKLDKRAQHRDYKKMEACANTKVLIIGAGPCGLRMAIEVALLGGRAVVVEKRDRFSRNNVLHLWNFVIADLRNLGAKKFFGKFCAGSIEHISIRQLQCILMKVALLLGVEVHVNVAFEELIEPPEDQSNSTGWRCRLTPSNHPVSEYEFDVLVGADGKRNTVPGFQRKEFRGKLAIAITANFINRNTNAEARVEEISGVAFIFNQKFFLDLKEKTGIDLENIVYYKDETHYFVMTAKKASLLEKGVLKEDYSDTVQLLSRDNVDQDALLSYAKEAANFSTNQQLPCLDYAVNHYGQADIAMFDFTSMFASENACRAMERHGHTLFVGIVGDSLLEPFWPTGSGCARGFLGVYDTAWMIKSIAAGKLSPLQVIAERESTYQMLSQTTPENLAKNHNTYSIDPNTRYPTLNVRNGLKPVQVKHLYDGPISNMLIEEVADDIPAKRARNSAPTYSNDLIDSYSLLRWCQRVLNSGRFRNVHVVDFAGSWRSGLAFCALIHAFRPNLIDFNLLMESDVAKNNQMAFDVAEKELGVPPVMTGDDMAQTTIPDKLTLVSYISQLYAVFRTEPLPTVTVQVQRRHQTEPSPKNLRSPSRKISLLHRLSNRFSKTKRVSRLPGKLKKDMTEIVDLHLQGKSAPNHDMTENVELMKYKKLPMDEIANRLFDEKRGDDGLPTRGRSKDGVQGVNVTAMAEILASKFRGDEPTAPAKKQARVNQLAAAKPESEFCAFCHKRVYIMERMSAEGVFFHRGCLKCDHCSTNLRLNNYSCDREINGEVKFYCYRHTNADQRVRMKRKRIVYDEEGSKENIPTVVTMSMSKTGKDSVILPAQKKEETPKKTSPPLSPLQVPIDPFEQAKKTPERVEFENTFEGLEEESEEEQFEHNLRASFSSDMLLDDEDELDESDTDSDGPKFPPLLSGGEDDVLMDPSDSDINRSMTWEDACKLAESWSRRHSREDLDQVGVDENRAAYARLGDSDEEDDDEDTTEVEESDSGSEEESTDVETEEEKTEGRDDVHTRSTEQSEDTSPLKSPSVSAALSARANFFATPPEPVRIDAVKALGLSDQAKGATSQEEEPSDPTQTDKTDNQVSELSCEENGTDEDVLDVEEEEMSEGEDADVEEEGMDEELDKTAVSRAMEQLLKDMDRHSPVESESGEGRVVLTDSEEQESELESDGDRVGEDTELAVLRSVCDMKDTWSEEGEDGGTLQQVLKDVEDMDKDDQGDPEVSLDNIDDSFVTRRRKKRKAALRKAEVCAEHSDSSSFTISTPSKNSSLSSLNDEVEYNKNFCDDDDLKPDADMLRDYTVTLSTMLGESFSDSDNPPVDLKDADTTLQGDEKMDETPVSADNSVYLTPTVSSAKDDQRQSGNSDMFLTPEVNDPQIEGQTPKAEPDKADKLSPKKLVNSSDSPVKSIENLKQSSPVKSKRIILSPVKITEPDPAFSRAPKPTERKSLSKQSIPQPKLSISPKASATRAKSPKPSRIKAVSPKPEPKLSPKPSRIKPVSPKPEPKLSPKPAPARRQLPPSPRQKSPDTTSTTNSTPSFTRPTASSRAKWSDTDSRESSTSPTYSPVKTPKQTKTKIAVDRNRLKSDSSSEIQTSDDPGSSRKKIPLDRSLIKTDSKSFEEVDIPFADENDLDDRFYTPATSIKARPPLIQKGGDGKVKKRILPTPPSPGVLSPDQIQKIQKEERERNRMKARDKPPVSEGGIQCVNRTFNNPVVPRASGQNSDRDRRSCSTSSFDPYTSDVVTDSVDSKLYSIHSPTSSAAESDKTASSKKKKKTDKTKDKADKEKKRKSLLSKLLPGKSPEKTNKESYTTSNTSDSSSSKKKKTPKSDKKKRTKGKDVLDSSLTDNLKDLKIGSVFTTDVSKLPGNRHNLNTLTIAPRAEVDEFSDSGESMMSSSTFGRKSLNLSGDRLEERISRRVQRAAQRQQKQAEHKRLRMAQEIQRKLEEVDVKQRELEQRGIIVEKALRGEGPDGDKDEADLMQEWFNLVHEKNGLVRYESELMVRAKELELEDRQARLENQLRECMSSADPTASKSDAEILEEKGILDELLEVVEQRDSLVAMLEEDRLREQEEDRDLEEVMLKKGYAMSPLSIPGRHDTVDAT